MGRKPEGLPAGYYSLREYAKRKGVSHPAVRDAINAGKIERGTGYVEFGQNWYVVEAVADRQWYSHWTGRGNTNPALGVTLAPGGMDDDDDTDRATKNRIGLKDKEQLLDIALKKEKLLAQKKLTVPRADVDKALFAKAQEIRNELLSIPNRVIHNLRAAKTTHEAEQLLRTEIENSLRRLADAELKKTLDNI